jgi:ParB-like chromosome segregation protein Spo0J
MTDLMPFCDTTCSTEEGVTVITRVAVADLSPGFQLRLGKINQDHVNAIALAGGNWPPIIVHRADNSIIDGHYRYLAACQLGHSQIDCIYFEGGKESAFLEALRQNRDHGLPLSLRDREAAARQVLALHPDWSDRRVGFICGLAPGTVSRLRTKVVGASDQDGQLHARVGRDGKRRPVDPRASRSRIVSALRAQPDGSLRNIARVTGTSPATVRAVRAERNPARNGNEHKASNVLPAAPFSPGWIFDAALLSAVDGESFARWFERTSIGDEWPAFVMGIPISRIYEVADEARRRAAAWLEFASTVEERVRSRQSISACS